MSVVDLTVDADLLGELGLGALTPVARCSVVEHMHEALEQRIGRAIAEQVSAEQLAEFVSLEGDDEAVIAWLDEHAPEHVTIVRREFDRLVCEMAGLAPLLLLLEPSLFA